MESTLYPLDQISNIAVSMYVATKDEICPYDVAERESQKISTLQNFYTIDGADHGFPVSNKSDFVDLLVKELTTETVSTANRETITLEAVYAVKDEALGDDKDWDSEDQQAFEEWMAENGYTDG